MQSEAAHRSNGERPLEQSINLEMNRPVNSLPTTSKPDCIFCGKHDHWSASCKNIARTICGLIDYRGRICGNWSGHTDPHSFVPRTVRED
jgi:hypothetical protein